MGVLLVFLCVLSFSHMSMCLEVWTFGQDQENSREVYHTYGTQGILEKTKHLKLYVPNCYDVIQVRVNIANTFSTPSVSYNQHTQMVDIKYAWWQYSWSDFEVHVRGKVKNTDGCGTSSSSP